MAVNTFDVTLAAGTPVDLLQQAAIMAEVPAGLGLFVQNTSETTVHLAETATAPTEGGHLLYPGDALVLTVSAGSPFWVWAEEAATLAVSGTE